MNCGRALNEGRRAGRDAVNREAERANNLEAMTAVYRSLQLRDEENVNCRDNT